MNNAAERLTRALEQQSIPVFGVSIGRADDRTTWRIDYKPEATAQHLVEGEAIRAAFDPTAASVIDAEIAVRAGISSSDKDRLADIALMVRYRDVTAWNALSLAEKVNLVRQQQTVWESIRDFIEKNL